jgi:preprotein translocase subunit SecG
MGVLGIFLLVLFVITALLLILLVLVQNEEGDSLGGVFAGGSSSAFGSRSGNILTRASSVLGAVFLVLSLALAIVNRTPGVSGVEAAGRQTISEESADWWKGDAALETAPGVSVPESTTESVTLPDAGSGPLDSGAQNEE